MTDKEDNSQSDLISEAEEQHKQAEYNKTKEVTGTIVKFLQHYQNTMNISDGIIICALARVIGLLIGTSPQDHQKIILKNVNDIINNCVDASNFHEAEKAKEQSKEATKQ